MTKTGLTGLICLALVLSSCQGAKSLDVLKQSKQRAPLELPDPEPVDLKEVRWKVITENNVDDIMKKLKDKKQAQALMGLTAKQYQHLAKNNVKLRNYIRKLKDALQAYKQYYEQNDGRKRKQ